MSLFYPALLLVFHTLVVAIYMGLRRYRAVRRREIPLDYYEAYVGQEPEWHRVLSRHVINLLETPLLFYVLTLIAYVTQQAAPALVGLAWVYVGLRLVHSAVHLGPNVVIWRFRVFALSVLVLLAYLLLIALGLMRAA